MNRAILFVLLFCGCSSSPRELVGTILLDNSPMEWASIECWQADEPHGSFTTSGQDGAFVLTEPAGFRSGVFTFVVRDQLYQQELLKIERRKKFYPDKPPRTASADRVPGKYQHRESTPLVFDFAVGRGFTDLPPLQLQSP